MAKNRTETPAEELSARWWRVEDLEPDGEGGLRPKPEPKRVYRIDLPNIQEQILLDYARIYDEKDAVDFLNSWGSPVHQVHDREELVSINPDVFEKKTIKQQFLESAASMHWLYCLADSVIGNDVSSINGWCVLKKTKDGNLQVYLRPNISGYFVNFTHVYVAGGWKDNRSLFANRSLSDPVYYDAARWKQHGDKAYIYTAQSYLKRVFDSALEGISPTTVWVQHPNGDWQLQLTFLVDCPLQAAHYALARYLTGDTKFGKCIRCKLPFARKRSDKQTCSDKCEAWKLRNIGSTRKYRKENAR